MKIHNFTFNNLNFKAQFNVKCNKACDCKHVFLQKMDLSPTKYHLVFINYKLVFCKSTPALQIHY